MRFLLGYRKRFLWTGGVFACHCHEGQKPFHHQVSGLAGQGSTALRTIFHLAHALVAGTVTVLTLVNWWYHKLETHHAIKRIARNLCPYLDLLG